MAIPEKNSTAVTIVKATSNSTQSMTRDIPARPDAMNWMNMQNTIRASIGGLGDGTWREK